MLKNLEFSISKQNDIFQTENFSGEFGAISYYFLNKIKKIKIASCSYIKIWLTNEKSKREIIYKPADRILFVSTSFDFTSYPLLSENEKLHFQYKIMHYILQCTFIKYEIDWAILNDINKELEDNNWQMKLIWISKKITKDYRFKIIIYLNIDSFSFTCEVLKDKNKTEFQIFKSLPNYFVLEFLFKKFQINGNELKLGNREKAIFKINLETSEVIIIEDRKNLIEDWMIYK
jgi:hypothetical protein